MCVRERERERESVCERERVNLGTAGREPGRGFENVPRCAWREQHPPAQDYGSRVEDLGVLGCAQTQRKVPISVRQENEKRLGPHNLNN